MQKLITGDCYEVLKKRRKNSVDLVVASPPYSNQRRYGSSAPLFRDDWHWLDWCAARFMECVRVSRGLVCFVVEGYTKGGSFHPLPEMLTVEVMRRGANIRRRAIYHRFGTPGGSNDELAQHHEIVVMASELVGPLPFSDPKAKGKPPKFKPGGNPTSRTKSDKRTNDGAGCDCPHPKYESGNCCQQCGAKKPQVYKPPKICKASNVISCGAVGGGNMGSKFSSENEAPFKELIPELLIASYCPPGGTVLDPFCGSGTTGAAAVKLRRKFIGIDNRDSQIELTRQRLTEALQ